MSTLKIGELTAQRGEKATGFVPVPGVKNDIPVTLICGAKEGKTVLITAGVHNAEYVGIQTAIELAKEIQPEELTGNLVIVHLMNRSGFEHRTMSLVYEDEKNLNRVFPGDPNGTEADKISHTVVQEFQRKADYYIDLHCGDGYEDLTPYVYCQGAGFPETIRKSREMAEAVAVPYLVCSPVKTGGAYNYAGSCGIPGILIERGALALWTPEEVDSYKADVRNVLRRLKVLAGAEVKMNQPPKDVGKVYYPAAGSTGCWYPNLKVGDHFKKGAVLGEIRDYFGNLLETCVAEDDGILLYQVKSLSIIEGGSMVAYGDGVSDLL